LAASPPPGRIARRAPAKINLFLHVVGRRADGYHLLESQIAFAATHDRLTVAPARTLTLVRSGPFAPALGDAGDDLVMRAARALAAHSRPGGGASMHLVKRLPVAAGIGGGSADAAAALVALDRLWGLDLAPLELRRIGLDLGADIPVCLFARPALVSGIGERIAAAPPMPALAMVLANPGVALSTAQVFAARRGRFSTPQGGLPGGRDMRAFIAALRLRGNDLETAAKGCAPGIATALAALEAAPGCLLARLSGSGPTCFALFESQTAARRAAARISAARPGWWVRATRLVRSR
jgi:4-diphosphocytidyl-2-C-methyl-D-erythritol kinase